MKIEIENKVMGSMVEDFLKELGKFCGLNVLADGNHLRLQLSNTEYSRYYKVIFSVEVDEIPEKKK